MNFIKKNINNIVVMVIYITMFYLVPILTNKIFNNIITTSEQSYVYTVSLNMFIYILLLVSCVILLKNEIKTDFNILNKTNAINTFYICLIGIICAYLASILGNIISLILSGSNQSQNQQGIEILLSTKYGPILIIAIVFMGPIVEELVFRKAIHNTLRNCNVPTWLILIISSLLFGLIHVIDAKDFVQIFPYLFMGFVLGSAEIYSKNIYPSIIIHIILNSISVVMLIWTTMIENLGLM